MLLSLMYHHCESDEFSNSKDILEKHFEYIAKNYKTIFCGDKISLFKTDLLLVFDDGFYDFYYYVFPLLKKYNIKSVLSIPTKYILDDTNNGSETRLSIKHTDMIYNPDVIKDAPFCTWKEIKEMSDSGVVQIASHSINHLDLRILPHNEIVKEVKLSRDIIENKLSKNCEIFVYPYGAYNKSVRQIVKKYYRYDIGIGSEYNLSYNNTIKRLYADDLADCCKILNTRNKLSYFVRTITPQKLKKVIKWIIRKNY